MSRNSEWEYFTGMMLFVDHLTQPDLEYKNWNTCLILDPESLVKFNKLKEPLPDGTEGILNEIKLHDDGQYVQFRRPMTKVWNGIETQLTPPIVLDANNEPFQGKIGSGSKLEVKVEVYKYNKPFKKGKGRAMRLVAVKIHDLVPYTKSDFTEKEEKASSGFPESPKQLF